MATQPIHKQDRPLDPPSKDPTRRLLAQEPLQEKNPEKLTEIVAALTPAPEKETSKRSPTIEVGSHRLNPLTWRYWRERPYLPRRALAMQMPESKGKKIIDSLSWLDFFFAAMILVSLLGLVYIFTK